MTALPCSEASLAAGEALIGTAPDAVAWLCLEQNGPWGRKAFTTSHLDPGLGAQLEDAATAAGVRPSLIRRPGRHADIACGTRTILAASTHPGRSWLVRAELHDPALLLELDWAALADGDLEATLATLPGAIIEDEPVLLICTNGTRDTCCARLGRPVAAAAAQGQPGRVWEITHTSGHRLAPTTVLLPPGYLHGRVLDAGAILKDADAGRLRLDGLRGRSTWPAAAQVAEARVREREGIVGLDELTVAPAGSDAWRIVHRDGRDWTVDVDSQLDGERNESCGRAPATIRRWRAAIRAS